MGDYLPKITELPCKCDDLSIVLSIRISRNLVISYHQNHVNLCPKIGANKLTLYLEQKEKKLR